MSNAFSTILISGIIACGVIAGFYFLINMQSQKAAFNNSVREELAKIDPEHRTAYLNYLGIADTGIIR